MQERGAVDRRKRRFGMVWVPIINKVRHCPADLQYSLAHIALRIANRLRKSLRSGASAVFCHTAEKIGDKKACREHARRPQPCKWTQIVYIIDNELVAGRTKAALEPRKARS